MCRPAPDAYAELSKAALDDRAAYASRPGMPDCRSSPLSWTPSSPALCLLLAPSHSPPA
jgi:hypothetical protein